MIFTLFMVFLVLLRFSELRHSKRNEKWLLQNGAIEYGREHYPIMVLLHACFMISLVIEYTTQSTASYSLVLIIIYLLLITFKAWIVWSLGKFWNTRIYRIKEFPLVNKGVYKFIKHPNYILVIAEIAIIPLAFHLYYTAIIFSFLNLIMLFVRIRVENKALQI